MPAHYQPGETENSHDLQTHQQDPLRKQTETRNLPGAGTNCGHCSDSRAMTSRIKDIMKYFMSMPLTAQMKGTPSEDVRYVTDMRRKIIILCLGWGGVSFKKFPSGGQSTQAAELLNKTRKQYGEWELKVARGHCPNTLHRQRWFLICPQAVVQLPMAMA